MADFRDIIFGEETKNDYKELSNLVGDTQVL